VSDKLSDEWSKFLSRLHPAELEALKAAGIDPGNPSDAEPPLPHRYIYGDSYENKLSLQEFWRKENEGESSVYGSLASIVAKVIDAFDCTTNKEVLLHNDCVRIALGYRNYKSMADLADKYNLTRAAVSWRVKKIQARIGTEPSIYMRSESTCQKIRQKALKKK
jgi:hypothetical protein